MYGIERSKMKYNIAKPMSVKTGAFQGTIFLSDVFWRQVQRNTLFVFILQIFEYSLRANFKYVFYPKIDDVTAIYSVQLFLFGQIGQNQSK